MFRFECPECGITLSAPDSTAWKPARCKACGARFIVPESPKAALSRLAPPDAQTDQHPTNPQDCLLTIGAFHVEALYRLGQLRFAAWLAKMVNEYKALNIPVEQWPDLADVWRRLKAGEGPAADLPQEWRDGMRAGDVVDRTWQRRRSIEAEKATDQHLTSPLEKGDLGADGIWRGYVARVSGAKPSPIDEIREGAVHSPQAPGLPATSSHGVVKTRRPATDTPLTHTDVRPTRVPRLGKLAAAGGLAALGALGEILLLATYLLNALSGVVSGTWLLVLWEWKVVVFGVGMSLFMPWAFSIVILPQLLLVALCGAFLDAKRRTSAVLGGLVASLYANAVLASWVGIVFFLFIGLAPRINPVCLVLWGYSTVMAPLAYMARQEGRNSTGTAIGLLVAELSYISLAITWWAGAPFRICVTVLVGVVILAGSTTAILAALTFTPHSGEDSVF